MSDRSDPPGATTTVTAAAPGEAQPAPTDEIPPDGTLGDGAAVPVRRVLIVDDDPDLTRLVRLRLEAAGFATEAEADGQGGLRHVRRSPPDLLFLDVSLPDIDGLEVLEQVRATGADLAVVVMTAFSTEEVAVGALRRGADDYLRKPFRRDELRAVLERVVSRLELRRQNAALQRQLDEKRLQLERELARAARVQADLLPRDLPLLAGFDLAARCVPAREVGGDFYSWQMPDPGVLRLTLGDVMGKGMAAALLMTTVRAAVHAAVRHLSPSSAVDVAAQALETDLDRSGSFATLFHAQLELATRRLVYVDAGHGLGFVRRADGSLVELDVRGLPLGVLSGVAYGEGSITLDPGDVLVVYSDGLVDARPDLPITPVTLAAALGERGSARDMVGRLIDLAALSGPPPDDLTVLVLRCQQDAW